MGVSSSVNEFCFHHGYPPLAKAMEGVAWLLTVLPIAEFDVTIRYDHESQTWTWYSDDASDSNPEDHAKLEGYFKAIVALYAVSAFAFVGGWAFAVPVGPVHVLFALLLIPAAGSAASITRVDVDVVDLATRVDG